MQWRSLLKDVFCVCPALHSFEFGLIYTLQVWMVTVFLHCWQRTEQHQENLQEQRCTTSARPALYPGPQHTSSQPSGASREVPGWFVFFIYLKKKTQHNVLRFPFKTGSSQQCVCRVYFSHRCIFYRLFQGSRSLDPDGRNLGRVQGRASLWQQGVWPASPGVAGRFWIQHGWGGPESGMMSRELVWKPKGAISKT